MVKYLVAAAVLTVMLGGAAQAQTELDHRVQKAWDDLFNPGPPGDPRTNWERARDADIHRQREAEEHAEWCRAHPSVASCAREYSRY